jgi:hypothetical protein
MGDVMKHLYFLFLPKFLSTAILAVPYKKLSAKPILKNTQNNILTTASYKNLNI